MKINDELLALYIEAMEAIGGQVESVRGPLEDECCRENRLLARRMKMALKKYKPQLLKTKGQANAK